MRELEQRLTAALAAAVRRASPAGRRRVMSGRAGRAIVALVFFGMTRSFDAARGADLDAVIRWEVGAPGESPVVRDLVLRGGRARVRRTSGRAPDTTIGLDETTLIELAADALDAPAAYLQGRLRLEGDMMLALQMSKLFAALGDTPAER